MTATPGAALLDGPREICFIGLDMAPAMMPTMSGLRLIRAIGLIRCGARERRQRYVRIETGLEDLYGDEPEDVRLTGAQAAQVVAAETRHAYVVARDAAKTLTDIRLLLAAGDHQPAWCGEIDLQTEVGAFLHRPLDHRRIHELADRLYVDLGDYRQREDRALARAQLAETLYVRARREVIRARTGWSPSGAAGPHEGIRHALAS